MVSEKCKKDCCGCGACVAACPKGAILLTIDSEGFEYPSIDVSKCSKCGLCDKVCAFGRIPKKNETTCYVAQHTDEDVCANSTSGGVYTALSDAILRENGVVYSPDFTEERLVAHKRITTALERDHSCGSKYVQSRPNGFHTALLQDLKQDRTVLFCGTPCQVSGVLSIVPQNYQDNLYCVDVICNGVGSPMVWKSFIENLEKKYHNKMDKYVFRPKTQGYLTSEEVVIWKNGNIKQIKPEYDRYNPFYHQGYITRPSCIGCKYASLSRVSDITIGDYSKPNEVLPGLERGRGLSTILVNTEKGAKLLALCREQLNLFSCPAETIMQVRLQRGAVENPEREKFLKCVSEEGFLKARNKKYYFVKRIKMQIAPLLRKGKK